jgi:hypothetical protein
VETANVRHVSSFSLGIPLPPLLSGKGFKEKPLTLENGAKVC